MITEEVKLNTKDKDYQNKRGTLNTVTELNNKIWGETGEAVILYLT